MICMLRQNGKLWHHLPKQAVVKGDVIPGLSVSVLILIINTQKTEQVNLLAVNIIHILQLNYF